MYDSIITLFNYREHERLWYTTVFQGVNLIELQNNNARMHGETNRDAVEVIIHVQPNQRTDTIIYEPNSITDALGNVLIADNGARVAYADPDTNENRQYIGPKSYEVLESTRGYFTFRPGKDFFVVGNYSSVEPINDDDYDDGLYSVMNEAQDGVYMLTSATYFSLLPHFEIGGM